MKVLGWDIQRKGRFGLTVSKAVLPSGRLLSAPSDRGWLTIFESNLGSWQRNVEVNPQNVLAFTTLYSCITLIASDIGKLGLGLMEKAETIWKETESGAFSPVLKKPNRYQTRQQFVEQWMLSKLTHGNAYILKERDARNVVVRLYPLDPHLVRPLIATNGEVFYELNQDQLSGVLSDIPAIPASEIIHDRMSCIFHPLVGVSPIFACGLAAQQGLNIQGMSAKFFENGAQPGGVLTAPNKIADETAKRLKDHWEKNYTGENAGRVAVLGDGLKYEAMAINAVDADLVAQLKMSAEMVCSAFHVPGYKVGVGPMPTYQNAEVLNQIYYSDCLQSHIEAIEALIDEGLAVPKGMRAEFDLYDLLRMDTATKVKSTADAIGAGFLAPNEGRAKFNLAPVTGGETPYLQQQNYSLEALSKRDKDDPFAKPAPAPAPVPEDDQEEVANAVRESLAVIVSEAREAIIKAQAVEVEKKEERDAERLAKSFLLKLHSAEVIGG